MFKSEAFLYQTYTYQISNVDILLSWLSDILSFAFYNIIFVVQNKIFSYYSRVQYQIHRAHRPQGSYPHNNPQDNDIDDDLEVNMALGAPDLASLLVYDYYPGKT